MIVDGKQVRPVDMTAKLIFPFWKSKPGDEEFTIMRVFVCGNKDGKKKEYTYNVFDRTDLKTGTSSMARTTGFTCTAVARLVIEGIYKRKGISPPEYVGEEEDCFFYVMNYLAKRGVVYRVKETN